MHRRIVSLWFPRLASDRILRINPVEAPFAVTHHEKNMERLYCLNSQAVQQGLVQGMGLSDARALCPDLRTGPANLHADHHFLSALLRWADRYCPWVGFDGNDSLLLDVTGSTHLLGGEEEMLEDIHQRLTHSRLHVRSGLAGTRGAAWAISRYSKGIVPQDKLKIALSPLPVAALRLDDATCTALQRLGLRTIGELMAMPRATISRRFSLDVVRRMDQALGDQSEQIEPESPKISYAARITFPDPIGLYGDVIAGLERLLNRICNKLKRQESGARALRLTCQRVDQAAVQAELRLARPMREAECILPLFERSVRELDAGYGIDQLRLEAFDVEPLPLVQVDANTAHQDSGDALDDLITRLGSRIGLDNIIRFLPAESHVPERAFVEASAAYTSPESKWPRNQGSQRPLRLFSPEPINATSKIPPRKFCWRRMHFSLVKATGPERIAPEWWLDDPSWRSGVRDYWHIETKQGRRLWMFYTPRHSAWFVQGEFA
ncbi:Y-family DNA polymerase [Pseudovibrio ascidiaceicola]|uniref:Y-family DNA polymerase n=1 Tax=Pseudovibrio ascidiaceicola TaxID=285279 RepID=UPI000D686C88|nr:DNA polymerase Y family protein [Pseudovibrio ascidiaceicola]